MAPVEEPDNPGKDSGPADKEQSNDSSPVKDAAPTDVERLRVRCWGCGKLIQLPAEAVPEGFVAADIRFTCGGCGADNFPHSVCVRIEPSRGTCSRLVRASKKWIGRALLVIVPSIIIFIGFAGFYLFLGIAAPPELVPSTIAHIVLAIFLEVEIFWNYFVSVLTAPSSPTPGVEYGTTRAAADGRLKGFTLCRRCEVPRPPRAHHCSTCGTCAHDLDHHCIFLHNCVGYANRRSFVLFLLWTVLGCAYPVVMLVLSIYWNSSAVARIAFPQCMPYDIQRSFAYWAGHRPYSADYIGGFSSVGCDAAPAPRYPWMPPDPKELREESGFLAKGDIDCVDWINAGILILFFCLSWGIMVGVGGLLVNQTVSLSWASNSIEFKNAAPMTATTYWGRFREGFANIQKTLGPVYTWPLLRRGPLSEERGGLSPPRVLAPLGPEQAENVQS